MPKFKPQSFYLNKSKEWNKRTEEKRNEEKLLTNDQKEIIAKGM